MQRSDLLDYLNELLQVNKFQDYCPNGLQVEGLTEINHIVSGVTACEALLRAAIASKADTILVHHGYFWRNELPMVTGIKRKRLALLLQHDLNLLAYHLPLDAHPMYGNNVALAKCLGITIQEPISLLATQGCLLKGIFPRPISIEDCALQVEKALARKPLVIKANPKPIQTIAWCTGGGQDFIDYAVMAGCDVFLTGEASERTTHTAREAGIHFIAAGHHATERYGVRALGEHLAQRFNLQHHFIDIENPV